MDFRALIWANYRFSPRLANVNLGSASLPGHGYVTNSTVSLYKCCTRMQFRVSMAKVLLVDEIAI